MRYIAFLSGKCPSVMPFFIVDPGKKLWLIHRLETLSLHDTVVDCYRRSKDPSHTRKGVYCSFCKAGAI